MKTKKIVIIDCGSEISKTIEAKIEELRCDVELIYIPDATNKFKRESILLYPPIIVPELFKPPMTRADRRKQKRKKY